MVPRYWTMRGYRVERRFGWDTHGLPIEMEVEKALGISGPRQIAEYGIDRFNEACRALVPTNTENWSRVIRRIGRWVDMDNDYNTMDTDFMERVWWVLRQLWDKGLLYRDFKVLPYSWGATTPLSNFEANLGGYRDIDDPSITVRLRVRDDHGPLRVGDCTAWFGLLPPGPFRPTWPSRSGPMSPTSPSRKRAVGHGLLEIGSRAISPNRPRSWPGDGRRAGRSPLPAGLRLFRVAPRPMGPSS